MREEYDFSGMGERQMKDRIRFLSDRLEAIFNKIEPQLEEFNLTKDELDSLLEYAENDSEEKS